MLVDDVFQMRAQRLVGLAAIKKAPNPAPQRALTVRLSAAGVGITARIGHLLNSPWVMRLGAARFMLRRKSHK
jgi:hypothetical protein